jgi:hypothetical protein
MDRLHVVIAPHPNWTDVLAMSGPDEVLRARLGAPSQVHRLAAPLLLEGLSLWYQRPLSVVLSVPESGASSPLTLSLSDGFRFGDSTMCYAVDVCGPGRRRSQRLGGPGDFRALRRLCQAGER